VNIFKLITIISILIASNTVEATDETSWSGVAKIRHSVMAKRVQDYVVKHLPSLKNIEIKFIAVNASYSFESKYANLDVLFMHANSFIAGSNHKRTVYVEGKEKILEMSMVQYIFVDFNKEGFPEKHRIEELAFEGSKANFTKVFKEF